MTKSKASMTRSDAAEAPAPVDELVNEMERRFGSGALMRLGDAAASLNVGAIPTGAPLARRPRSASADCRAGGSSRSTAPRAPANPPLRST